jgi:hypothetical protein
MRSRSWQLATTAAAAIIALTPSLSSAQQTPEGVPNPEQLAKQLANPIANLVSIPLQFNWDQGVGDDNELRTVINFQPVVPVTLNDDWNLIARMILPYVNQPSLVPGAPTASGTGDILFSTFLSPADAHGAVWGVGPAIALPTTTDPLLGSGKWSAGPTLVVLKQAGAFTYGALANHLWSYADTGDIERPDVDQTFVQPFFAYTTKTGVSYSAQAEAAANWNAASGDEWTIPVSVSASKVIRLGPFPFSIGFGGGVFVARPSGAPDWRIRFSATLILPRTR